MTVGLIDANRVAALAGRPVDQLSKAIPPGTAQQTVAEFLAGAPRLADFSLPLLTLDDGALRHNITTMQHWVDRTGFLLAPHGKTTMAPQLWQRQLDAGAWGITVANPAQLEVAWEFGVTTVMVANPVLDPVALRWIARELSSGRFRLLAWADSVAAVEQMDAGLASAEQPLQVCVELGAAGGRTGARTIEEARSIARAVVAADQLQLAGVAGYEGALAHDDRPESLATVDRYLNTMLELHDCLEEHYEIDRPVVTVGGSAFFDRVAVVLAGLPGADVVLRSGAYVVHDDGYYAGVSPWDRLPGRDGFRSAMHGWARVLSRPEPGLALLDMGKRDLPYDEGLPVPQQQRRRVGGPIAFADGRVTAINDQHLFLQFNPQTEVQVGEVVRLGLSHPCTALDKWSVIPVIDDADAEQPAVVDLIRTFF